MRVAGKFQDVPLGDAQVFEDFPWRMLSALRPLSTHVDREVLDCRIKVRVGVTPLEEAE
jgi:hypothetical protein